MSCPVDARRRSIGGMARGQGPEGISNTARLGVVAGGAFALVLLAPFTSALAQLPAAPAPPPAPELPAPPAVPAAPTAPPPPDLPPAPARPPALPAPAPAGNAKPPPRPPLAPPRESDVILLEDRPRDVDNVGGGKLPRELQAGPAAPRRNHEGEEEDKLGLKADTPVVTPSMRQEGTRAALGSVIVLTKKDLSARGYADLSQLLDDLPGTDVVRPWGDVYVRSYVRGNRTVGADPYLLLVDGVEMNHLFTRSAQILAALPISNVERVEIVLGPLSSVYGTNAAMGVIHVITDSGRDRQDASYYGTNVDARVTFGGPQSNFSRFADLSKLVDASASYIGREYRIRLTARLESGAFDRGAGDSFNFTKSSLYTDQATWGAGTLNAYPNLAGALASPDRKGAVDARVYLGRGTEIAAQLFTLSTGYGVEYPGDRRQTAGLVTSREWSAYARHTAEVTSGLVSTTLLQLRKSDIDLASLTSNGAQVKLLEAESPSSAALLREDLEINTRRGLLLEDDQLGVGVGLRYEFLSLPGSATGQYVTSSSTWAPGDDPRTAAQVGPDLTTSAAVPGQSFDEIGSYFLARYSFNRHHHVHTGLRVDKSTARSDVNASVRLGYSGTFLDMLTFKLWYGHSIFEPSLQQDLAATAAPATPPTLTVSRLHTVESDIDFTLPFLALHLDGYFIHESNPVVAFQPTDPTTAGSFINMGDRELAGIDAGVRLRLKPVNAWVYYTHNFHIDDGRPTVLPAGTAATLGDIAANKLWAGLTATLGSFTGTVLNRWMITYDAVPTNKAGAPAFYSTLDANLMVSDVGVDGFWLAFRVTNIIGSAYAQPGIQTADSGDKGAASLGLFSSRLPQPGRGFFATAGFRFDQDKPLHR
jgi:outer membrane receptor for ferrienterochelin and colicins